MMPMKAMKETTPKAKTAMKAMTPMKAMKAPSPKAMEDSLAVALGESGSTQMRHTDVKAQYRLMDPSGSMHRLERVFQGSGFTVVRRPFGSL